MSDHPFLMGSQTHCCSTYQRLPPNLLLIRAEVPGGGAGDRKGEVVVVPGALPCAGGVGERRDEAVEAEHDV